MTDREYSRRLTRWRELAARLRRPGLSPAEFAEYCELCLRLEAEALLCQSPNICKTCPPPPAQ